jgi:PAS domain S-box-containing protein
MDAHKSTILAIDDVPNNLVALEAVLSSDNNLVYANSGKEAIEILKSRNDIDIILLDLQMPEMDGFETAKKIKEIKGCEDIPIIFITAYFKEDPFVKKGYEHGAVDYFSKPFDPDILKMKVKIYSSFRHRASLLVERERQLKASEELLNTGKKLSSILESLPVGVIISDSQGRVIQTNEEVQRIFKQTKSIIHDTYGEILGWWDSSGSLLKGKEGPLSRALAGQPSSNEFLQVRCVDRSFKTILCSASPLRSTAGETVGAVVVIQDVTVPREIEKDLEKRITSLVSLGVQIEQSSKH